MSWKKWIISNIIYHLFSFQLIMNNTQVILIIILVFLIFILIGLCIATCLQVIITKKYFIYKIIQVRVFSFSEPFLQIKTKKTIHFVRWFNNWCQYASSLGKKQQFFWQVSGFISYVLERLRELKSIGCAFASQITFMMLSQLLAICFDEYFLLENLANLEKLFENEMRKIILSRIFL